MSIQTIRWVGGINGYLKIIDQTSIPHKFHYLICRDWRSVFNAIRKLQVRGAPAIGIAAAYGLVLGISRSKNAHKFLDELIRIKKKLSSARPTAVNLSWALERMYQTTRQNFHHPLPLVKKILLQEARQIHQEDKQVCQMLGRYGNTLIKNGDRILTYCNAGALATGGCGTALAALYQAKKQGKKFRVYAPETRPFLQGARLTAWELIRSGIDVTLLCDNMIARLMQEKKVDCVIVGADRVVANGDAANKIGTYGIALLARTHKIPFYVVIPTSSLDLNLSSGQEIPIEYRPPAEVTHFCGRRIAPDKVKVYNPSFDVTPARYITAIVTEYGIIKPPYRKNLNLIKKRGGL